MASRLGMALSRVQAFVLEPPSAEAVAPEALPAPREANPAQRGTADRPPAGERAQRLELAVLGLRAGCGATTLARGLAATLADGGRTAHLVELGEQPWSLSGGRGALSTWEVPDALRDPSEVEEYGRMVACLAGEGAALVWDLPPGEILRGAGAARRADAVVAVARGSDEPALAVLVAQMLGERFGRVVLATNSTQAPERWEGRADVCLPRSRTGARVAARGRRPPGSFGAALTKLAELAERSCP